MGFTTWITHWIYRYCSRRMIINGAIRMQMGTWSLTVTRFFFCVQLAGWASHCAVCALAPTGSNKFLFLGRSCKDPHRIFGHIGQDKRAIPLLFSLCWEYVANTNMICVYQKKSQSLRHLLQSVEGSSLVTYTCPFRLWLLLEYDHELRFTCTRI